MKKTARLIWKYIAAFPLFIVSVFQNLFAKPIRVMDPIAQDPPPKKNRPGNRPPRKQYALKRGKVNYPFTRSEILTYFDKNPGSVLITNSVAAVTPGGTVFVPNRASRKLMYKSKDPKIIAMRKEYFENVKKETEKRLRKSMKDQLKQSKNIGVTATPWNKDEAA